jgi:hypothetical protein
LAGAQPVARMRMREAAISNCGLGSVAFVRMRDNHMVLSKVFSDRGMGWIKQTIGLYIKELPRAWGWRMSGCFV